MELVYHLGNKKLLLAGTRGDGEMGSVLYHACDLKETFGFEHIKGVPLVLGDTTDLMTLIENHCIELSESSDDFLLVVRGGVMGLKQDDNGVYYPLDRSEISGKLMGHDNYNRKDLIFMPYSINPILAKTQTLIPINRDQMFFTKQGVLLDDLNLGVNKHLLMKEYGLDLPDVYRILITSDVNEIIAYYRDLGQYIYHNERPLFNCDGVVVTLNDYTIYHSIGHTKHHPRGALAIKFKLSQDRMLKSKIIGIELQMGKTNKVVPVAQIEPVTFKMGKFEREVSSVNLYGQSFLDLHRLNIGSEVLISLSGLVIPNIVENLSKEKDAPYLISEQTCPYCHGKLTQDKKHYYCQNNQCCKEIFPFIKKIVSLNKQSIQISDDELLEIVSKLVEVTQVKCTKTLLDKDKMIELIGSHQELKSFYQQVFQSKHLKRVKPKTYIEMVYGSSLSEDDVLTLINNFK